MAWIYVLCMLVFLTTCFIAEESFERVKRAPGSNCPRFSTFNGKVKYRRRGTRAVFRCGKSFTRYGNKAVNCRADNTWSGEPPVCIKANCVPKDIRHLEKLDMTELYGGALLSFACEDNYQLIGITEIYCNGKVWNADPPVCKAPTQLLECDFEDDLCGWSQGDSDDLDWTRHQGQTSTGGTGPRTDHTLQTVSGHYMFVESSNPAKNGDQARLGSPVYPADMGSMCFEFWYHILGPDDTGHVGSLEVYIMGESEFIDDIQPVFVKVGNQGDEWRRGEIYIDKRDEPYQIVITTVRKLSYISDIAIDDVRLYNCSGTTHVPSTSQPTITTTPSSTTTPAISSKPSSAGISSFSSRKTSLQSSSINLQSSSLPSAISTRKTTTQSKSQSLAVSVLTTTAQRKSPSVTSTMKTPSKAILTSSIQSPPSLTTLNSDLTTSTVSQSTEKSTVSTVPTTTTSIATIPPSTTSGMKVSTASSTKPSTTDAKTSTVSVMTTTEGLTSTVTPSKGTTSVLTTSTEATTQPVMSTTKSTMNTATTAKSATKSTTKQTTNLTQTRKASTISSTTAQPSPSKIFSTLLPKTPTASMTTQISSASTLFLTTQKISTTTQQPLPTTTAALTTTRRQTRMSSTKSTSKTSTAKTSSVYPKTSSSTKTKTMKSTVRTKPTQPTTNVKPTKRSTTAAVKNKSSMKTTKPLRSTTPVSGSKAETTGTIVYPPTSESNNTKIKISIAEQRAQHPEDETLKPLMIGLGVGIFCGLIVIGVIAWVCVRRRKFYTSRYEDELKPITKSSSNDNFNGVQYEYHDDEYEQ